MAKTQILDYYVHLTDKSTVDTYNDQLADPNLWATASPQLGVPWIFIPSTGKYAILRAPCLGGANVEFSAPCQDENVTFSAPCIRSPWFVPGANNFPRNVATFTRKSGGWFGIPLLFGQTTKFYWAGHFVYAPPPGTQVIDGDDNVVPTPALIPARRWVHGWEIPDGEGSSGEGGMVGPAGSRWLTGWGFCPRNAAVSDNAHQFPSTPAVHTHWDRFRFRVVRFGTAAHRIFTVQQVAMSGQGFDVAVSPAGQLVFQKDDGSVMATAGSVTIGAWQKVDVLHVWNGIVGPPDVKVGYLEWYLNGARIAQLSYPSVGGLTGNVKLAFTKVSDDSGNGDAYIDFDDWIGAEPPQDKDGMLAHWSSTGISYSVGDVRHYDGVPTSLGIGGPKFPSSVNAFKCIQAHVSSPANNPASASTLWAKLGHSKDWTVGSRVVPIEPTAVAGDDANWSGDILSIIGRNPEGFPTVPIGRSSTTAGAVTYCDTNITKVMNIPGCLGIVAAIVNLYSTRGTLSGTLGYNVNGGGDVMNAIVQPGSGAFGWAISPGTGLFAGSLYAPSGLLEAVVPTSFRMRHTKGADAVNSTLKALRGAVEVIGLFGSEDIPPGSVGNPVFPVQHGDKHNEPYEFSPYSRNTSRAHAPVIIHTGTYVGNGTATNILFRAPVHWLWVRRVTGTSDLGARWFSVAPGGWTEGQEGLDQNAMVRAEKDPTFVPAGGEDDQAERYRITMSGTGAHINASGVTYHFVAISDPAARFILGVALHSDDIAPGTPFTVALSNPLFTALAGFFHSMSRSTTTSNTMAYKAPGMAAAAGRVIGAVADVTPFVTFQAGSIVVDTSFATSDPDHLHCVLFRSEDGNLDPNAKKIWSHLTYVGDGAASRSLSFSPATGLRPVWAIVLGGTTYFRDPAHTGANSTLFSSGTQAATGITAGGIDSITVGSSLNTNGTTYHIFVLWGSATAGNGGWSIDGEFVPVEPDSEKPPTWAEPVEFTPPTGPPAPPGGGDVDTGTDPGNGDGPTLDIPDLADDLALGAICVTPTVALANLALSRIGSNAEITQLATSDSAEATAIRRHYDLSLQATLKDRPWPFATRYVALTLLTGSVGSPANPDWTFAYRLPDGCLQARRLSVTRGTAVDPTPPPFREGQGVLFTNEVSPRLEYTARVACPARISDPTFLNAWAWRLAHEIAPALTRIPEKQAECWAQYERALVQFDTYNKLGAPGPRPAAPANDPDAACAAVKLQAVNVGLMRIGAKTIASLTTEQSREAVSANLAYEDELQAVLRDHAWSFARRYTDPVTLVRGPAWSGATVQAWSSTQNYVKGDTVTSGGTVYYAIAASLNQIPPNATFWSTTPTTEANNDWTYAYRMPTGKLRFLRVERRGQGRRALDMDPPAFELGSDATGELVMTDERDAILVYITRPNCALSIGDALFRDAFSWRIAAVLAPSLAAVEPHAAEQVATPADPAQPRRSEGAALRLQQLREQRGKYAWAMYQQTLNIAEAANANEQQQDDEGDAAWIRDRQ